MRKRILSLFTATCLIILCMVKSVPAGEPPLQLRSADGDFGLAFSLQYRPRFEYNEAKDFAEDTDNEFVSHRARLGLKAFYKDFTEVFFQVQDVRLWGEEASTLGDFDADGFDLHQGYLLMKYDDMCFLKLGRQEIAFDGHRIIGTVNWTQQARAFDGIHAGYRSKRYSFSAVYAKLTEGESASGEDADLFILHGSVKPTEALYASLLVVYDYRDPFDINRWTFGPHATFETGGFHAAVEGYGQIGERKTDSPFSAGEADYAAFLASARVGYTMDSPYKPTLDVWFDYLSGDEDPGDDTIKVFDTLFATNHKFYGFMDLFLNIPAHTGGLGLMDLGAMASCRVHEFLTCRLDFHHFRTAEDTPTGESILGNELDFTVKVPCPRGVTFSGGISVFMQGEAMEYLRSDDESTEIFGFVMADVRI